MSAGKHRKPKVSAGTAADLSAMREKEGLGKKGKKTPRALHHYKQPPNRLTPTKLFTLTEVGVTKWGDKSLWLLAALALRSPRCSCCVNPF